jgi:peroxiredoxin Q/BCP
MDAYRDQYATLFHDGNGVTLLAISVDSAAVLASWGKDRAYPFRLLSDPDGAVGRLYGAYEPAYRMDNRTLFVVGRDGRIAYVAAPFEEIDPQAYTSLQGAIDRLVK